MSVASTTLRPSQRLRGTPFRGGSIGGWQTGRRIGRGTYCDIFLARPEHSAGEYFDYVAKVSKPEYQGWKTLVQLLRQEVYVTQSICSPHILPVIDAGNDEAGHFLILPRVEGESLEQQLRRSGPLDGLNAIWIMRQVAQALAAVHQAGWLHADVKPENILLSSSGHVTLIDFGFASPIQSPVRREQATVPRHGTLRYMAPECHVQGYPIGPATDLYSLGVTLFELLAGHPLPEMGLNQFTLANTLPNEDSSLLRELLANDPLRRPQSASEVARRLAAIETQLLCTAAA